MIKSIFIDPRKIDKIEASGANHLIVFLNGLTKASWRNLHSHIESGKVKLAISLTAFAQGGCPADPQALDKLLSALDAALKFNPAEIWLDHFRFDGHWESIKTTNIPQLHPDCEFCSKKDRVSVLLSLANRIINHVNGKTKVGYFAVPFKNEEVPQLIKNLGQDHSVLGKIFDLSSPMLYHRMIKKPVSYISDYVTYIHNQTAKPVLPIIQIKDMPDDLEDKLTEEEVTQAFNEAIKLPSIGVCFFYWTHALEKQKTNIVTKLYENI